MKLDDSQLSPFQSTSKIALAFFACCLLAAATFAADTAPADAIDWARAKTLHQREQQGEKLTADEQAYLDRAKAEHQKGDREGRPSDADMAKARELHQKSERGEKLTAEEEAFFEKIKDAVQKSQKGGQQPARQGPAAGKPEITDKESTGLVPLSQLKADQKYKGFDGGLYGGGKNSPPESHAKLAQSAAAQVVPLDAAGKPASDGKVVLMSIGMSNTTGEFSRFKQTADRDSDKSPTLLIVDGAQGGKDAPAWVNVANSNTNPTWEEADRRIKAAGATAQQVQVVWIKQAIARPSGLGDFPAHAEALQKDLETILKIAKTRYPNLRLAYLSSRIYAGYASTQLNPEPFAYEGAFSVRWLIENQVKQESKTTDTESKGEAKTPIALWGPYLWADGIKGREGDDLVWKREDLGGDGTHPSPLGQEKVTQLLLKFFKTDPTTKVWFSKQ